MKPRKSTRPSKPRRPRYRRMSDARFLAVLAETVKALGTTLAEVLK